MLPPATVELYDAQRARVAATLALLGPAWAGLDPLDVWASWALLGARLTSLVSASMVGAARDGAAAVDAALGELGVDEPALGEVNPRAFGASASDGRPLESLLRLAPLTVERAVGTPADRLAEGWRFLAVGAHTQVQDAARGAAATAITARRGVGWVRAVRPPACSRCAILAGRFYPYSAGFKRHPGCNCQHRPAHKSEPAKGYTDEVLDPKDMTDLTKAQRAALADGANLNRVVNASRRGARRGRGRLTTTNERVTLTPSERPTPDAIMRRARSREEAVELLRKHGYLTAPRSAVAAPRPAAKPVTVDPSVPAKVRELFPAKTWRSADALTGANLDRATEAKEFKENCVGTVTAYELRARGLDVTAKGRLGGTPLVDFVHLWRTPDGAVPTFANTMNRTEKTIREWPTGARGFLVVKWKGGGSHALMVEHRADGIRYFDPQKGIEYTPDDLKARTVSKYAHLLRADDLTPTTGVDWLVRAAA